MRFIVAALSALLLIGCGGGGGNSNSDINSLYIENSEFFTSFTLDSDVTISRGLSYYPVSEDIFIDFLNNAKYRGFFEDHAYAPTCYEYGSSDDIAETCSDIVNGERWVTMFVDNVTDTNTDEYVKGFFPQLNASLSTRILSVDFYGDKSVQLSKHEKHLKERLGFENYNDGTSDICLRKYEGEIVYLFCYRIDNSRSYASWAIAKKTFFDASLSDIDSLYIENSEFFTSLDSFIPISDATIGRGLLYYPVADDVFENFINKIGPDFDSFVYDDETCYELDDESDEDVAGTCTWITNGERFVSIRVNNTTNTNTASSAYEAYEYVIGFFPQLNASLSARNLFIDFDDDKSIQLLAYEEYLRDTLKFEDYNNKCLKLDGDEIVYSFCYGIDGYRSYASWLISKKTLFYASLNSL
jgi:hypothetical protein